MLNKLLQEEGILAGTSCGTLLEAAVEWCKAQKEPKIEVKMKHRTKNNPSDDFKFVVNYEVELSKEEQEKAAKEQVRLEVERKRLEIEREKQEKESPIQWG